MKHFLQSPDDPKDRKSQHDPSEHEEKKKTWEKEKQPVDKNMRFALYILGGVSTLFLVTCFLFPERADALGNLLQNVAMAIVGFFFGRQK